MTKITDWITEEDRREQIREGAKLVIGVEQPNPSEWRLPGKIRVVVYRGRLYCTKCKSFDCKHVFAVRLVSGLENDVRPKWASTPQAIGLPAKFPRWRPVQAAAITRLLETDKKFIVVEAPTGTGKSLIAAAWQKLTGKQMLYLCTTKQLQDQLVDDFSYASILKGRANYPTRNDPTKTCADCEKRGDGTKCSLCWVRDREDGVPIHECPYMEAKEKLLGSQFGIVNTALYLLEANYVGRLSGWPIVVADEADLLEQALMSHIEVVISHYFVKWFELKPPDLITNQESWRVWAEGLRDKLDGYIRYEGNKWDPKFLRRVEGLVKRIKYFIKHSKENVWVNCTRDHDWKNTWVFRPVRVAEFAKDNLWKHGQRWLMMSAYIPIDAFCRELGLDRGQVEYIRLPSAFPVDRRPIYYQPATAMSYKTRATTTKDMTVAVAKIVDEHPGKKILIHTVSYWLTRRIVDALDSSRAVFSYFSASDRSSALDDFRAGPSGSVLVAASMERGVDLPYDDCNIVIMPKVPYPPLGDQQVSARLYSQQDGQLWYRLQTVRSIVQASGRAMRHPDDYCATYILDEEFGKLYNKNKDLFPSWWRASLHK